MLVARILLSGAQRSLGRNATPAMSLVVRAAGGLAAAHFAQRLTHCTGNPTTWMPGAPIQKEMLAGAEAAREASREEDRGAREEEGQQTREDRERRSRSERECSDEPAAPSVAHDIVFVEGNKVYHDLLKEAVVRKIARSRF